MAFCLDAIEDLWKGLGLCRVALVDIGKDRESPVIDEKGQSDEGAVVALLLGVPVGG